MEKWGGEQLFPTAGCRGAPEAPGCSGTRWPRGLLESLPRAWRSLPLATTSWPTIHPSRKGSLASSGPQNPSRNSATCLQTLARSGGEVAPIVTGSEGKPLVTPCSATESAASEHPHAQPLSCPPPPPVLGSPLGQGLHTQGAWGKERPKPQPETC